MPGPTGLAKPATFDHLKKKKPLERIVTIPLDDECVERFERAKDAVERAKLLKEPTEDLEAKLAEARAEVEANSVRMVFRCIGRKAYDALVDAHPPTPEQITQFREDNSTPDGKPATKGKPPYDIEKFAPALVQASCADPQLTLEQVNELFDEWNSTELAELWVAALEVNTQRRVVTLGNG